MPSGISTGPAPARCAYDTAAFNRPRPATGSPCRTLAARAVMTPPGPCLTSGPRLPRLEHEADMQPAVPYYPWPLRCLSRRPTPRTSCSPVFLVAAVHRWPLAAMTAGLLDAIV